MHEEFHDPDWSHAGYKCSTEENFIIPLPNGFYEAVHNFVFDCMQALEDTRYVYDDVNKSSDPHEAKMDFLITKDAIKELVIRLKDWKNGIHQSGATHISGYDYWSIVNILVVIRYTLSINSSYTQDRIYKHGNNYRVNATNLYNAFVSNRFAAGKANFMQPLYKEVKALREEND